MTLTHTLAGGKSPELSERIGQPNIKNAAFSFAVKGGFKKYLCDVLSL